MNQLSTSLWGDEAFSVVASQNNFLRMMEIVLKDTHPPLYYWLLFPWMRIFGDSEIAVRSLSLVLIIATAFITYLIAKKLWNRSTGLLAGLLTLTNPFLFQFAFEARMYALMVFSSTLSFYFLVTNNFWGYVLAAAAALYSQHYSVLVIFFQFIYRLTTTKNLKKNWFKTLKPFLIIGLLYAPWLYPLYRQVTMVAGGFWLGKPVLKDVFNLYIKYLQEPKFSAWQKYLPWLALAISLLKSWWQDLKKTWLIAGWIFVPVLTAFIISQLATPIFYDRYLILIIPALAIFLASQFRKISLGLIIILILSWGQISYHYFTHPSKRPFQQLAQYIKSQLKVDDFLINYNGSAHHLWETKYYGLTAPIYVPGDDLPYYVGTAQMTAQDTIKLLPNKGRIGAISSEPKENITVKNYTQTACQQFDTLVFCWLVKNN